MSDGSVGRASDSNSFRDFLPCGYLVCADISSATPASTSGSKVTVVLWASQARRSRCRAFGMRLVCCYCTSLPRACSLSACASIPSNRAGRSCVLRQGIRTRMRARRADKEMTRLPIKRIHPHCRTIARFHVLYCNYKITSGASPVGVPRNASRAVPA